MAIKITYIIDSFTTNKAGTEKQLGYLLTHLPKSGFSVQLISFQDSPFLKEEAQNLFPSAAFGSLGASSDISKSPISLMRLFLMLRRSRPEIVHTFFPTSNSVGVIIARLAGIRKVVSSRRDMGFNLSKKDVRLLRTANRFVSCIVANSVAVQNCTIALEGVDQSKTRVIYNGVSLDSFGDSLARRHGNEQVVGIVANMNRTVKRVDLFIRAAALVRTAFPGVVFWVVGNGYLRPELERLASSLHLDSNLLFLGRRNDVRELLKQMTISVICSDSEGFSNAIMEYMAAGLPVVATNTGGNPELVLQEETGLLVPPDNPRALADAVIKLIKEPDLSRSMGDNGRQFVRREFSIDKMLLEMQAIYHSLVA